MILLILLQRLFDFLERHSTTPTAINIQWRNATDVHRARAHLILDKFPQLQTYILHTASKLSTFEAANAIKLACLAKSRQKSMKLTLNSKLLKAPLTMNPEPKVSLPVKTLV